MELSEDIPEDFMKWDDIMKGGLNGIFLVLLALSWWGVGIQETCKKNERDEFAIALHQVSWLLEIFLNIIKEPDIDISETRKWGASAEGEKAAKR